MQVKRVCIVGLGLMGGSLALALRPYFSHLSIVDTNPQALAAAKEFADLTTADLAVGVGSAELVILATPVRTILKLLVELPAIRPDGCLVIDLGSTKAEICQTMEQLPKSFQVIGGHPLCGKETAGFAAATPDLFRDQTFVLCRHGRTTESVEQVVEGIIDKIGARTLYLEPEIHDQLAAATSHLPYLISALLMRTVASQRDERLWQMSASGFRDTARLAGSNPQMMLDILLTNRMEAIDQVDRLQSQLITLKQLLLWGDETAINDWLTEAQRRHAAYRRAKQR